MHPTRITALVVCALCTVPLAGQTRTSADYSTQAAVVEQSRTSWRFESDGTGRKETYVRVRIQSDAAVQEWGQIVLGYNAANERLEIGPVRVHKAAGDVITAPASAIQDLTSAVERVAPVYSDAREMHVTVPALRPGDVLEFTAVTTIRTPLAPRQFWTEYNFSNSGIVLDEQLTIDVPADREITLKTGDGFTPTIDEHAGRRVYQWHSARLKDETPEERRKLWAKMKKPKPAAVRLTTFQSWDALARWYATLERGPRTPTDEVRRKAAQLTAGRATNLEKLQALYEYVSEDFRYVSLSFGVGRYQPHPAADVLHNQYGDCKDKHTLLASLAESAGVHASAALINSHGEVDPDFPSPSQFDHVITRAQIDGNDVWLDTTPEIAPFRLIAPNLRHKHALLVDGEGGRLVDTPEELPVPHSSSVKIDAELDDAGSLSAHVALAFAGDYELAFRWMFRQTPKAEWKTLLGGMLKREGLDGDVDDWNVTDPAALGTPFAITYTTKQANFVTWTKKQFDLKMPLVDFLGRPGDADEDDDKIDLGPARRATYSLRLRLPASYSTHPPLGVSVSRDYGEYRATYSMDGGLFASERTLTVRQRELDRNRRDDYQAFNRVITRDFDQTLALERPVATSAAAAPAGMKTDELYDSGYAAVESGSYAQAVALLKRVTELEPKHKHAWNELGRAYVELNRIDEAVDALRTQISINPYDLNAYNNLGRAYSARRRFTEAEAAFQKQIEINPLDRFAHKNLGEMYLEWRKYEAAAGELEKAITLTPGEARLHVRLGEAYLNLGDQTRAMAAFNRAAEITPEEQTWNEIAYQLAIHHTNLDLAERYAETAVSTVTLRSRNWSLDRVSAWDMYYVGELAAVWDTLGWVKFAQNDLAGAERFVKASWALVQHAEVGDHLGQIYEKRGQRAEAIRMYALALNAERPDERIRERLAALLGSNGQVDAVVKSHRDDLLHDRTLPVDAHGPDGARADFLILFDRRTVEDVRFAEGDERLRPLTDTLRTLKYLPLYPDEAPAKMIRRGTLSCDAARGGSCQLTLALPRDAQIAQQK